MKNKSTKIVVILLVIVLIIAALAAGVVAMIFTGNLALTDKQKLAKGLNDIGERLSGWVDYDSNYIQEYEKMYTTPFESQTIITGKVNTLEMESLESMQGVSEILDEAKELTENLKITNTVQADLKNNLVVENLKLEMGDVIDEISLDLEYNKDTIALRSKELNEKYLTLKKDEVESNSQYAELLETFEVIEALCEKQNLSQLEFTEEEILHFQENYTGIFSNYLTDETITSTNTTITVDGKATNCSAVSIVFDKNIIQSIVGEYLQGFENDAKGKAIIVNKMAVLSEDFNEEDLSETIEGIRSELLNIEDDTKITFTVYCSNLKTYGFDFEIFAAAESVKINGILENNDMNLKLTLNEQELATGTVTANEINIITNAEDSAVTLNAKKEGNKTTLTMGMNSEEGQTFNIVFTYEESTRTELETKEKYSLRFSLNAEEDVVDVTLNVDSNFKYLSTISTTTFDSDNSINMITETEDALQNYLNTATTNGQAILQKAQQNSLIVSTLLQGYQSLMNTAQDATEEAYGTLDTQVVETFNIRFLAYEGKQKGTGVKALLRAIANNNQSQGEAHTIAAVLIEENSILLNSINPAEITLATNDIKSAETYTVMILEYDTEGYVKTIAIKK